MLFSVMGVLVIACTSLCFAGPELSSGALHSVEAQFTQEKHLRILQHPLRSHGVFAFQTPGSLRWEYLEPVHSVLLLHQGQARKFIERDGLFHEDSGMGIDAMQVILQDIGNWLEGRFTENPQFLVEKKGTHLVELRPKEEALQQIFQRIELRLGPEKGMISQVTLVEDGGAYTRLNFSQTTINRKLAEQRFTQP